MKKGFATYKELNDIPSLVNLLRAAAGKDGEKLGVPSYLVVPLANAATAIEGLIDERERLADKYDKLLGIVREIDHLVHGIAKHGGWTTILLKSIAMK